jgi:hypothetical protein
LTNFRDASPSLLAKDAVITLRRYRREVNGHTSSVAQVSKVINGTIIRMTEAMVPGLECGLLRSHIGMLDRKLSSGQGIEPTGSEGAREHMVAVARLDPTVGSIKGGNAAVGLTEG